MDRKYIPCLVALCIVMAVAGCSQQVKIQEAEQVQQATPTEPAEPPDLLGNC